LVLLQVVEQAHGVGAEAAVLVDEERRLAQLVGGEREQVALVGDHAGVEQRLAAL
jgi:hypothetical protein